MDVRMPDGTLVRNVPDDITQTDLLARYNKFKAPEPEEVKPPEKGNFITDTLGGLATGAGKLMATPTEFTGLLSGEKPYKAEDTPEALLKSAGIPSSAEDVYKGVLNALTPKSALGLEGIQNKISGLGSGILNPFKATQPLSAELQAAGENIKSTKEKRLEAERAAAIDKEEGLLNEAKTAVGFTLSNPSMLPGFIAEQIPNLLLPAGAGKLGMGVAKSLITNATEKALTRVGVSSAVAAAAAQQGGDTGADTYEAVHKYLIDQGVPEKEAHDIAVEKSKVAAGKAAAISVATGFIPGANALERKLIGAAETGVAKKGLSKYATTGLNVAGEATQEGIEEGGGKYVSNVGLQQVAPETDVMKGVGSSAGLGMLGGAIFGGLTHGAGRTPSTQTPIAKNEWVLDENGNLVKNPETQIEPKGTVTLGPIENAAQQDLFGAGELPNQVDQGILNEKQKQESEIERNIFALQQQEQTPEVKQQIEALQAQLPKGPGQTLDTLQEEHSALNRAYTALDTQKATLEQQRNAIPKLDDKLAITNQIKAIEAQQTQIDTRRAELQEQAKKLAKQITPEETTAQRKLKEVSPIVSNVMSKFGLTPKAPIRNAIKNLDMTVPEDRQTFIDEINKHSIKGAKINMEEVEKYLSYFEEKPSGELNRVDTGAVKPSVPVSGEGTTPTEGLTAPVATGMENNIGTPVGPRAGTETLQNVQPDTLTPAQTMLQQEDEQQNKAFSDVENKVNEQATLLFGGNKILLDTFNAGGFDANANTKKAKVTNPITGVKFTPDQKQAYEAGHKYAQELKQAQELFGNESGKDTTLLRSGFTADDAAKALGIKEKPTPTSEGSTILNNLAAAGDVAPKAKTGWFTKTTEEVDKTLDNSFGGRIKNIFSVGNFWGFDQTYINVMRSEFLKLADEGKIVIKDALDALRRLEITQPLYRAQLAIEAIHKGKLVYDPVTNNQQVVEDADNMDTLNAQVKALANRVGISVDDALAAASKGFEANRIQSVYDKMNKAKAEITRIEKKIQAKVDTEQNKKMLKKLKADVDMYEKQTQHMTRQQAMEGMKIYNNVPEAQEIARIWQIMRERVIDKLVESGVTSKEKAERWLDEMAYVPFFRTIEEQKAAGMHIYNKGLGESMKEYAFEGSMLPVENTIGNMYQWMQWSYSRAISNQHQQVALDQMRAIFPDMVKDGRDPNGYSFTIYRDGIKREYSVANPLVAQYFTGVGNVIFAQSGIIKKYLNLFAKGITLAPGFSLSQLILKDTYEAMHTSGVENPYGIIVNIFEELAKTAMGKSEARKELISRGLLSTREHAMTASYDADIARKLEIKEAAIHNKIIKTLGKFSALSDNLLRQAVYQQLINEGVSKAEASSRATEIFNYRRTSGNSTMQFFNNYVPFMNAFTVSTQVAMNTISGKGITAQTKSKGYATLGQATLLIGLGNLMYMMMVGDDEEYKRMNRYKRDKSYVIPGTGMSIPLREGLFTLDKLAAEYAYNVTTNSNITDAQMFKDAAKRAIVKQITPPISPIITAPLGTALNKDLSNLTDARDIVNVSQSKIEPEYQVNKNTSELAKFIGKEGHISPLKVDYFLKTSLGGYMTTMLSLSEAYMADRKGISLPLKENAHPALEALGFSSYLSKPGTPNVVPDLYTAAHEVDKTLPTIMKLAKTGQGEEAHKLIEERRANLGPSKEAAKYENILNQYNASENIIRNRRNNEIVQIQDSPFYGKPYTPEVKKAMIDELDKKRIALTPKVMELRKKIYEK